MAGEKGTIKNNTNEDTTTWRCLNNCGFSGGMSDYRITNFAPSSSFPECNRAIRCPKCSTLNGEIPNTTTPKTFLKEMEASQARWKRVRAIKS